MTDKPPLISICMATYNGEKYIKEQLDSILCQVKGEYEIIVSDDESSDNTVEIINSFNNEKISIFTHKKIKNSYKSPYRNIYNVYRNFENALSNAKGDYIFLSDQDDIWMPNKIQRVMSAFNDGAWIVHHDNTLIDNEHHIIRKSYFSFVKPANTFYRTVIMCYFQGASMAFTRKVLNYSLPFPNNPISHDHWIGYNAYFRGHKIFLIKESLLLYRRHENNVSPSGRKSPNSLWFKINYRFRLFIAILTIKFRK